MDWEVRIALAVVKIMSAVGHITSALKRGQKARVAEYLREVADIASDVADALDALDGRTPGAEG